MATRLLSVPAGTVRIYANAEELAQKAAQYFARLADQYVLGQGRFSVALAGGSTPQAMLAVLAAEPFRSTIPWQSIHFYWGDERCVPPDDPQSNYGMAYETLLRHVPVPATNIARLRGEKEDTAAAAVLYAEKLRAELSGIALQSHSTNHPYLPRFDLIWLGLGNDGHTASLFPDSSALQAREDQIVAANYVAALNAQRLTLTVPAINNARNIAFLVAGANKADILAEVLQTGTATRYPAQLIKPSNGSLIWLTEEKAAQKLR